VSALLEHPVVLGEARRREVAAGTTVFAVGDATDTAQILEHGVVMIRSTTVDGDRAAVDVRGRGDLLGDTGLTGTSGALHLDEAVALTPCRLLELGAARLDELRDEYPEVAAALVAQLSAQVRRLSAALVDALGRPARVRTARRLASIADALARSGIEHQPVLLTQHDLAEYVGTTRPTINAQLSRMQALGAIEVARSRVTIVDPARLPIGS
jgi:CRP/FNR family transcriptional regulator, cyclic AMP receptor protein